MGNPNSIPFEVVAAPFTLWTGIIGTAYPLIDAVPAADWIVVGTSGVLSMTEDGVKVTQAQAITEWRSGGDTGVRKVFRTSEGFKAALTLADITLEQYRHALNMNPVTTVAAGSGTAGYKKIGLSRGSAVAQRAILIRGASPYGDDMAMQFEIPIAFQTGEQEVGLGKKGDPAGLMLEWTAIIDPSATNPLERYGRIIAQHQAAL